MIKRDELTDPDSCLNRAADDEPIFVLKATDESAPDIVEEWAFRYRSRKVGQGRYDEAAKRKFLSAIGLADQMVEWRERWLSKQNQKEDGK